MNKTEKYFSLLTEESGNVEGKFRKIDDAIIAAENHATATTVVYVVEQGDLAFYSTTSFKEAEEELKAEKKKIATQKMLATKEAKKAALEAKKDKPKEEENNSQELVEEEKVEESVVEKAEETSEPKAGDVFINVKGTEITKINAIYEGKWPFNVDIITIEKDKCGRKLSFKESRYISKIEGNPYDASKFDSLARIIKSAMDGFEF